MAGVDVSQGTEFEPVPMAGVDASQGTGTNTSVSTDQIAAIVTLPDNDGKSKEITLPVTIEEDGSACIEIPLDSELTPLIREQIQKENVRAGHKKVWTKKASELLPSLFDKLQEHRLAEDFYTMMSAVKEGLLKPDHIALRTVLDRAKMMYLKSTTQMRYDETTMRFFKLMVLEKQGRALNIMSGPRNRGTVSSGQTKRGMYPPKDCKTNFMVPSRKTLNKFDLTGNKLSKSIQPGLIEEAIKQIPPQAEVVLMGDAKTLARGLLPEGQGDVDLWGFENSPNKEEITRYGKFLQEELNKLKTDPSVENLRSTLSSYSDLMRRLIVREEYFENRRMRMTKRYAKENNKKSFEAGIAFVTAQVYDLKSSVERLRKCNGLIASLICHLEGFDHLFNAPSDPSRELMTLMHSCFLIQPVVLASNINLKRAPVLVKPRTVLWKTCINESMLSASTFFQGIGLETMTKMKEVLDGKCKFKQEEDSREFETEHYKAYSTIATKIVPTVLSNGRLRERGVFYLDSTNTSRFLAAAPQLVVDNLPNRCEVPILIRHCKAQEETALNTQDVCRALVEMMVLRENEVNVNRCLHVSISDTQAVVYEIRHDAFLVQDMFHVAMQVLDSNKTSVLTKKDIPWRSGFLERLNVIREHSKLCMDICPVSMTVGKLPDQMGVSPYTLSESAKINEPCPDRIAEMKLQIEIEGDLLLEKAHNLLRQPAEEIYCIMATDANRRGKGCMPDIPVAYALTPKGVSLTQLRSMMDVVMNKLKERKVRVQCQVFDGLHHGYISRAQWKSEQGEKTGFPLNRCRLQADTWNNFKAGTRNCLIKEFNSLTEVKPSDLEKLSAAERETGTGKVRRFGNLVLQHTNEVLTPRPFRKEGRTAEQRLQEEGSWVKPFDEMPRTPQQWIDIKNRWAEMREKQTDHGKFFLSSKGGHLDRNLTGGRLQTFVGNHFQTNDPEGFLTPEESGPVTKEQHDRRYRWQSMETTQRSTSIQIQPVYLQASGKREPESVTFRFGETTVDQFFETDEKYEDRKRAIFDLLLKRYPEFLVQLRNELIENAPRIFSSMNTQALLEKLMNPSSSYSKFTLARIKIIVNIVCSLLGVKLPSTGGKARLLSNISSFFGGDGVLEKHQWGKVVPEVPSLKTLATEVIKSVDYPVIVLKIALANAHHYVKKKKWTHYAEEICKMALEQQIDSDGNMLQMFSVPEYNHQRRQNEFKMCDAYHIFTNLRKGMTVQKGGYTEFNHKEAWLEVLNTNADLLTPAIVFQNVDKQNGDLARRVFCGKIQDILVDRYVRYENCLKALAARFDKRAILERAVREIVHSVVDKAVSESCDDSDEEMLAAAKAREAEDEIDEKILYMETNEESRKIALKCKETAEFVYHIRSFYEACDDRGLTADERVRRLAEMQKFLTDGMDFDHFTGQDFRVLKGIPSVTFESILGNVATRIQLYSQFRDGTYNARALSTLKLENFFSTLSRRSENDCPKAVDVPKKMAELMDLNIAAHMSTEELRFEYCPHVRVTYPVHKDDDDDGVSDIELPVSSDSKTYEEVPLFKNHFFDKRDPNKKQRRHKYGFVTNGLRPLKGVTTIRTKFYKIDESKINELHRRGITDDKLAVYNLQLASTCTDSYNQFSSSEYET